MLLWDSLRGDPHAGKQLQIYSFRSGDSAQSHEVFLKLAEKSGYSAEVYNKLEEFFTPRLPRRCRLGFHRGEASRMKRISSRLGSFLLDWLVDYGRHPRQAGRNIKGDAPVRQTAESEYIFYPQICRN